MAKPRFKVFARRRNSDDKAMVIATIWPAREGSKYPDNLDFQPKSPDNQYCRFDPQWDMDIRTVFEEPSEYFIDVRPVGESAPSARRPDRPARGTPARRPPPRREAARQHEEEADEPEEFDAAAAEGLFT